MEQLIFYPRIIKVDDTDRTINVIALVNEIYRWYDLHAEIGQSERLYQGYSINTKHFLSRWKKSIVNH